MPSKVRRWTGSAWQESHIYRWDGSAWKQCNLYRWNGSAWVQIQGETWFFNNGDAFSAVTGGWQFFASSMTTVAAPTQSKGGTTKLYLQECWNNSAIGTANMIDLTNISSIKVNYTVYAVNVGLGTTVDRPIRLSVRKNKDWATWDGNAAYTQVTTNMPSYTEKSGTLTLDTSSLTGSYYVAFQTQDLTSGNNFHRLQSWLDVWFGQ